MKVVLFKLLIGVIAIATMAAKCNDGSRGGKCEDAFKDKPKEISPVDESDVEIGLREVGLTEFQAEAVAFLLEQEGVTTMCHVFDLYEANKLEPCPTSAPLCTISKAHTLEEHFK